MVFVPFRSMAIRREMPESGIAAVLLVCFALTMNSTTFLLPRMSNSITSSKSSHTLSGDVSFPQTHFNARPGINICVGACAAMAAAVAGMPFARSCLLSKSVSSHLARSDRQIVSVAAFENEMGVQPPLGYWDPLGLSRGGDSAIFYRRRTVEIKHGRVCMLASIGYMMCEFYRWPGYASPSQKIAFTGIPNGLAAFSQLPSAGWFQILCFCGFMEKTFCYQDLNRAPGDTVGCGVLGVPGHSSTLRGEEKIRRLNGELANGRLAMFSIMGMLVQDGLTGSAWGDWSNYADSPLRAH